MEGLLTLARVDAGQLELRREPVDLRQVVENAMTLLKPLADQKQVELKSDLQNVQVVGDAERLGQVLTNLLNNAITYNREGGKVRLCLASEDGNATLTISDTGLGIATDDLPRIFERFYRGDKARTSNGGIGLGLAICQEVVHSHGGRIDVTSLVGEGTTFTVRFPLSSPNTTSLDSAVSRQ